jgi:hypothetical protein
VDSGLAALLGAWLILAPVVLGYGFVSSAVWNDMFVETLVVLLAGSKAVGLRRSTAMSWLNLVLGAWLLVGSHTIRTGLRSRFGATLERHHHRPTHHVPELA